MYVEGSLHDAVSGRDIDLTNILLKEGADPTEQNTKNRFTPLHVAVNSYTLYELSGQLQEYKLVNTLLSSQVEANIILNPYCKNGVSHLHIACIVNHVKAVELFAKAKVRELFNQPINDDTNHLPGYTPLHCAIRYSSVQVADILLRHGADIHTKNAKGMSCVHLLVKRLMNINDIITIGKCTPCVPYEEEIKRLESIVQLVLSARADDGIFVDDTGLTAFHLACTLGDKSIAEDFLRKGADVNKPVKSSSEFWPAWTPLHFAACFNIEMMVLLMQNGANILMKNLKGETALDSCAKRFNPADINLILSIDNELKDITLSDSYTRLSNLLLVTHDYDKFSDFLQKLKDVNIIIPFDCQIWPRYNLLHLCVSLNEKTICLYDFEEKLDLPEESKEKLDVPEANNATLKRYNCTEDEEALYVKRIELCLEHGCSVSMKDANKQTPIHLAFNMPSESAVAKLLSFSEDNVVDQNCLSHLHIACVLGHMDAVKKYVSRGADVNCRVNGGFDWHERRHEEQHRSKTVRANSTPLHLAVQFDHEDIVEYLLANNANVYAQDSMGFTPIHLTMYAYSSSVKMLFEATPNLRDSVSALGLSHLHVAARCNDGQAVDQLLLNGALIDSVIDADAKQIPLLAYYAGKTPLFLAHEEMVTTTLLEAGADMDAKDLEGVSALQHSLRFLCSEPVGEYIRMLKRGRGDVESCGMTLLHVACADFDIEWTKRLLSEGADVNARIRDREHMLHGATPLHVVLDQHASCAFSYHMLFEFVELLVDNGADVSAERGNGSTALHQMYEQFLYLRYEDEDLKSEATRTADLLLRSLKSHDVNPVNYQGFSHFHLACVINDVEMATKFLDRGVDVDAAMDPFGEESYGFAALHMAMAHRSTEIAHLLLERGANVNAEDVYGNKPLHVLNRNLCPMEKKFVDSALIEAMLSQGADIRAKNVDGETVLYCILKHSHLNVENYLKIFELLVDYGCDLDQEDKEGKPLSEAVNFHNLEAVNALLQLGVDVDDIHNMSQFSVDERSTREVEVVKALASHVWKMRFIRLDLKESNLRWLESVEKQFSLAASLEQSCQDELKKAKRTRICLNLTVKHFLSDLGTVAQYLRVSSIRSIVDKYFKGMNDLRREFPLFCGLLALQYKKATARKDL